MTTRTPIEIEKKIVAAYRTGKYTQAEVGKKYGVKTQTVHFILHSYSNGVVLGTGTLPEPSSKIIDIDKIQEEREEVRREALLYQIMNQMYLIEWSDNELPYVWNVMKSIHSLGVDKQK
jgi:transposase-like protein